ncbi:MAG: hypothetical protein ACREXX_04750 [Gammaproteobacteria bacterium]
MATIVIHDLEENRGQDKQAMTKIVGGFNYDAYFQSIFRNAWIVQPPMPRVQDIPWGAGAWNTDYLWGYFPSVQLPLTGYYWP